MQLEQATSGQPGPRAATRRGDASTQAGPGTAPMYRNHNHRHQADHCQLIKSKFHHLRLTKVSLVTLVIITLSSSPPLVVRCKPNNQLQQQQQQQHSLDKQLFRKALDQERNLDSAAGSPANRADGQASAAQSATTFLCPEQFGYYTDSKDCTKYYVCVFGEVLHESCTGGLRFSRELQTCDWPRNVDCPNQLAGNDSMTPTTIAATTAAAPTTQSSSPTAPTSSSISSSASTSTTTPANTLTTLSLPSTAQQTATTTTTTTTTTMSNGGSSPQSYMKSSASLAMHQQLDNSLNAANQQQQTLARSMKVPASMVFADEGSDPQQPSFDEAVSPVITADGAIHLHDGSGGTFSLTPNHNRALQASSPHLGGIDLNQNFNGPTSQHQQQQQGVNVFVKPLMTRQESSNSNKLASLRQSPAFSLTSGQSSDSPNTIRNNHQAANSNNRLQQQQQQQQHQQQNQLRLQANAATTTASNLNDDNANDSESTSDEAANSSPGDFSDEMAGNRDSNDDELDELPMPPAGDGSVGGQPDQESNESNSSGDNNGDISASNSNTNDQANGGAGNPFESAEFAHEQPANQANFGPMDGLASPGAYIPPVSISGGDSLLEAPRQALAQSPQMFQGPGQQQGRPSSQLISINSRQIVDPSRQTFKPIMHNNFLAPNNQLVSNPNINFSNNFNFNTNQEARGPGNFQAAANRPQVNLNNQRQLIASPNPFNQTGLEGGRRKLSPGPGGQAARQSRTSAMGANQQGGPLAPQVAHQVAHQAQARTPMLLPGGQQAPTNLNFIGHSNSSKPIRMQASQNSNNNNQFEPIQATSGAHTFKPRFPAPLASAPGPRSHESLVAAGPPQAGQRPPLSYPNNAPTSSSSSNNNLNNNHNNIGQPSVGLQQALGNNNVPHDQLGSHPSGLQANRPHLSGVGVVVARGPSEGQSLPAASFGPASQLLQQQQRRPRPPKRQQIPSGAGSGTPTPVGLAGPRRPAAGPVIDLELQPPEATGNFAPIGDAAPPTQRGAAQPESRGAGRAGDPRALRVSGNQQQQQRGLQAARVAQGQAAPAGWPQVQPQPQVQPATATATQATQATTEPATEAPAAPAVGATSSQLAANRYLNSAIDALEAGQPFGTVDYDFDILNDNTTERRSPVANPSTRPAGEPASPSDAEASSRSPGGRQAKPGVGQAGAPTTTTTTATATTTTSTAAAAATTTTSNNNGAQPTRKPRPTNKKIHVNHEQALANGRASTEPARRPEPLFATPAPLQTASKCDSRACRLPDCKCGDTLTPAGLDSKLVPQVILLTFDDAVNDLNWEIYEELFSGRTNPNGCPILATFYVSHEWTDYGQVQTLYSRGHEMASHSVTHSFGEKFSKSQWFKEVNGQREILNMYGGVKLNDVRGMRAPFLQIGGNKMFEMLYDANFTYDSSMPIFENSPPMWPYTLDYQLAHECMITPCPTKSFPGVWEVGMTMWVDLRGGRCSMGDACSNPADEDGVYEMLMKNFNRHYKSNRAPFGLFYHSAWFNTVHHRRGFLRFLATVNSLPEVFFVTNWQMLQWMRQPTPLSEINSFEPWQCPAKHDRPPPCYHPSVCNVKSEHGTRFMKTCQPCPVNQQYPWVGATGFKGKQTSSGSG